MLFIGNEVSSTGWVGGVVMHPTTQIQVIKASLGLNLSAYFSF